MKGCLTVLALLVASLASAAEITTVATVDTGSVIYYGHGPLARPYVFGTDGNETYVQFPADSSFAQAGLGWVPWRLDTTSLPSATSRVSAPGTLDAVFQDARATVNAEKLSGLDRANRLVELYQRSILIDSARVILTQDGPVIGIYPKNGLPILGAVDETKRPLPPASAMEKANNDVARIVSSLQSGRLVIVDDGIECSVAPKMINSVVSELHAIRAGHQPCLIKNQEIIRRFQQPPVSLSELVRGR